MENQEITFSLEVLGSGTSNGVPYLGCKCDVCSSSDPRDKRCRQSVFLRFSNGINILIDCGTDSRTQIIRSKIKSIDYVFLTHDHADHVHGISDLRLLAKEKEIPIYLENHTLTKVLETYRFLFNGQMKSVGSAKFSLNALEDVTKIGAINVVKVPLFHGKLLICGFRIGKLAYLTDVSRIPEESYPLLEGIDYLFIDALTPIFHETHFSYDDALNEIEKIRPKFAWFIHISHVSTFVETEKYIQKHCKDRPLLSGIEIHCSYDGMIVENIPACE